MRLAPAARYVSQGLRPAPTEPREVDAGFVEVPPVAALNLVHADRPDHDIDDDRHGAERRHQHPGDVQQRCYDHQLKQHTAIIISVTDD